MPDSGEAALLAIRLALPILVAITTSASAQKASAVERLLTPAETTIIQEAIKAKLLDPGAAQFRMNEYRVGSAYYCAIVNAKNRMGGYTGFQPFLIRLVDDDSTARPVAPITSLRAAVLDRDDNEGVITRAITERCTREGYRLSY